jgi:hypothetical protein
MDPRERTDLTLMGVKGPSSHPRALVCHHSERMTSLKRKILGKLRLRKRATNALRRAQRRVHAADPRWRTADDVGPTVAAVVVSLPERHHLLRQALASVRRQTRPPDDTVVGIDPYRRGEVGNMNRLLRAVDCEWIAFLHDDDIWMPRHLEVAERYMTDDNDVIVSRFKLVGRKESTIESQHDDFEDLRTTNWFPPSAVVVRASVFGEWCAPYGRFKWVDWANWNRLLDGGARFVHTNEVTMRYRFGWWDNGSWSGAAHHVAGRDIRSLG